MGKCPKCNKELENGKRFCPDCGTERELPEDKKKAHIFCYISIVLKIVAYILFFFVVKDSLVLPILLFVANWVILIYNKVMYPKNLFSNILFWINIFLSIIDTILIILICIAMAIGDITMTVFDGITSVIG